MRNDGHVSILAAAVTFVLPSCVHAVELVTNRRLGGHAAVVTARHASNSTDWTLIGVTEGRGVALAGARHRFLTTPRRHHLGPSSPFRGSRHLARISQSDVTRRCDERGHRVLPR